MPVEKSVNDLDFTPEYMQYLMSLEGKISRKQGLLELGDDNPFRIRLLKLLDRTRFAYLYTYCLLETPISVRDGWVFMYWSMPHNSSYVNFSFALNTNTNSAYIGSTIFLPDGDFSDPGDLTLFFDAPDEEVGNLPSFVKDNLIVIPPHLY